MASTLPSVCCHISGPVVSKCALRLAVLSNYKETLALLARKIDALKFITVWVATWFVHMALSILSACLLAWKKTVVDPNLKRWQLLIEKRLSNRQENVPVYLMIVIARIIKCHCWYWPHIRAKNSQHVYFLLNDKSCVYTAVIIFHHAYTHDY